MRRLLIAAIASAAIVLSGCTAENPEVVPSTPAPVESPSESITEGPTARPEPVPQPTDTPDREPSDPKPEPTRNPEPKPSASSTDAGTPGTQFAARWGKRYPDLPEFAIIRAANATCTIISNAPGENWNDNALAMAAIETAISGAGLNGNDAVEFAQDANQNYCSSVANPT